MNKKQKILTLVALAAFLWIISESLWHEEAHSYGLMVAQGL